nr:MAG TPA: hypothetical protein [Inoviridae sp.]
MKIFTSIFNALADLIMKFFNGLLALLPQSPFSAFLEAMEKWEFLKTLNWIVPISTFISIGTAWLTAIGIYYAWSVVLRWIKAIE